MLLLAIIYVEYIGLGIPDSLFGAAWPAIYRELSLPVSLASGVSVLVSLCTILSSLYGAGIINRYGPGRVAAASTAATALALAGCSFAQSAAPLLLFAVPLGLGAGVIDIGLNNYVALHYRAAQVNYLHCFYGAGVFLSPIVMSWALERFDWRTGYRAVALLQFGIAVIGFTALPLWHGRQNETESDAPQARTLSISQMLAIPGAVASWAAFFCSDSILVLCGTWTSTCLVNGYGFSPDAAARGAAVFYTGLTLGRFFSGIASDRIPGSTILRFALSGCGAGIALLALGVANPMFCLFLIGACVGPFFPMLTHLTPAWFGAESSQSLMGVQMASAYTGIMLNPAIFGLLLQRFSARLLPVYLAALFTGLAASLHVLLKRRAR